MYIGELKAKHFQLFFPSTSCCSVCLRTSKSLSVGEFDKCLKYTNKTYLLLTNEHHLYQVLSLICVYLCSFVHIGLWRRVREKRSKNRSFPGFVRSFLDQARSRLESRLVGVCQPPMCSTYFTIWRGTKAVIFIKSSSCEFEKLRQWF